jgi:hypothetical protein
MLFVISCVFSVIGFFLAFFGITYQNFTHHPKRILWLKWGMGICLGISLMFAFLENENDENKKIELRQNVRNLTVSDSISRLEIRDLKEENFSLHIRHQDSLKSYHADSKNELKEMAFAMTKIFAENSRINQHEHKATQKKLDSVSSSKPAYIHAIAEPSNVYQVYHENDTLTAIVTVENVGNLPAYNLEGKMSLILQTKEGYYNVTGEIVHHRHNLTADARRPYTIQVPINKDVYTRTTQVIFLLDLEYYLDYELKNKRLFSENFVKIPGERFSNTYTLDNKILLRACINGIPQK